MSSAIFILLVDIAMAVCPSLGYMSTAFRIGWLQCWKTLEGYSLFVSYILLASQSIRILYFSCSLNQSGKKSVAASSSVAATEDSLTTLAPTISSGENHKEEVEMPFSLALLAQSIIMLTTQMVLVLCVLHLYHKRKSESLTSAKSQDAVSESESLNLSPTSTTSPITSSNHSRNPSHQKVSSIASFSPSSSVVSLSPASTTNRSLPAGTGVAGGSGSDLPTTREFLDRFGVFSVALLFIAMIYPSEHLTPELLGYIALGIEAMLVAPQLLKNFRRKSCTGVTWELLLSWAGGDIAKFIYFVAKSQPAPFIVCNVFQLCLDGILIFQICTYGW